MGLIENIKSVADVIRKADNIDLYRQILDLQQEAMNLIEENNNLKLELRQLKEVGDLKEKLIFKENRYWLCHEDTEDEQFCSQCWDSESNLVHLHKYTEYYYQCPKCKMNLNDIPRTIVRGKSSYEEYMG